MFEAFPFLKEKLIDKEYEYVIRTGEIFLSEEKTEYHDEIIYTTTSKIPIKDKSGNVEKIITVIKDVSERKKLEGELKDSYEELRLTYLKLKELYKVKDSFLSNLSHELRTPLTSVLGYTELLLEEDINEEQRHKLEIILRNSKRLTRLIKSLLDTTLIESRNIQLDLQMVSINELVAQVAEDMKTIALVKNLPIYIEIPQLPLIQGDRDRLMQVFSNILDNAIKFTITGEIRIKAEDENENVHIKVSDTGIGIPEDKLGQVFNRFYQLTHQTREDTRALGWVYGFQKIS
jgi:signal transduction histidine kinase